MSIASKRHDQPDHDGCTLFPATLTRLPDSASDDPIHPHETQKVYLGAPPVARIPETGFDSAPSRNAEILSSYFIVVFFTVTVITVLAFFAALMLANCWRMPTTDQQAVIESAPWLSRVGFVTMIALLGKIGFGEGACRKTGGGHPNCASVISSWCVNERERVGSLDGRRPRSWGTSSRSSDRQTRRLPQLRRICRTAAERRGHSHSCHAPTALPLRAGGDNRYF
jgi:hypothetical protein